MKCTQAEKGILRQWCGGSMMWSLCPHNPACSALLIQVISLPRKTKNGRLGLIIIPAIFQRVVSGLAPASIRHGPSVSIKIATHALVRLTLERRRCPGTINKDNGWKVSMRSAV